MFIENQSKANDFHDLAMFLLKSGCQSHPPPPKLCAGLFSAAIGTDASGSGSATSLRGELPGENVTGIAGPGSEPQS